MFNLQMAVIENCCSLSQTHGAIFGKHMLLSFTSASVPTVLGGFIFAGQLPLANSDEDSKLYIR
jgi:hypothetical protein